MTQDFGFTGVLEKQAHSWLRNCFSSATVESKGKSDSGIIEFTFLSLHFKRRTKDPRSIVLMCVVHITKLVQH